MLLPAAALLALTLQSNGVTADELPYLIDSAGTPARNGSGSCWRTGFWSPAAAAAKMGSGELIACVCEPELVAADQCGGKAPPREDARRPAAQPTAPPVAAVQSTPKAPLKVRLSAEARFEFSTSLLDAATRDRLDDLVAALAEVELEVLLLVGHADRIGPADYNQAISEKRAAEVKLYLIEKGVPADRIYTEGKGESQPTLAAPCDAMGEETRANLALIGCLAANRRVEIEAIGIRARPVEPKSK